MSLVRSELVKLVRGLDRPPSQALCLPPSGGVFQQDSAPSSCFTCLIHAPSNTLTCGHRLCDACLLKRIHHAKQRCPLCGEVNKVDFHPKPVTSGVRILHLGGEMEDAEKIARLLQSLRSRLSGHLQYYFDLVVCSGVGIFFAVMMFCNGKSIEECMQCCTGRLKLKAKGVFDFGSGLKFSFSVLHRSRIKLVLRFEKHIMSSYGYVLRLAAVPVALHALLIIVGCLILPLYATMGWSTKSINDCGPPLKWTFLSRSGAKITSKDASPRSSISWLPLPSTWSLKRIRSFIRTPPCSYVSP